MVIARPNLLVVDDEPLARTRLLRLCERLDIFDAIALSDGGRSALRNISELKPDIILLDIDMPDLSGFTVAEQCRSLAEAPEIIFTTAHSRYAVDAFRLEATDYLLKPVKESLLKEAIDRAIRNMKRIADNQETKQNLSLWVKDGRGSVQLPVADIQYIEAERDYMRIHIKGQSFLLHQSMRVLEAKLPADKFIRIHRSTIVRADLIAQIRRMGRKNFLVLKNGIQLTIGAQYADRIGALA